MYLYYRFASQKVKSYAVFCLYAVAFTLSQVLFIVSIVRIMHEVAL